LEENIGDSFSGQVKATISSLLVKALNRASLTMCWTGSNCERSEQSPGQHWHSTRSLTKKRLPSQFIEVIGSAKPKPSRFPPWMLSFHYPRR
jgi:hypothetical protein